MDKVRVLEVAKSMLPKGSQLLYLTAFGSRLYGTETETSDYDFHGLFLPSLKDLSLMRTSKSCQFSTGDDRSKNNKGDFDIQVWSIQYWLTNLLPKMDTVALDLYFSYTNEDAVIFKEEILDDVFTHPESFIDSGQISNSAYIRYAMSQAKRYGVKGSKLHILRELQDFLGRLEVNFSSDFLRDSRLESIADAILAKFEDNEYLSSRELQEGTKALQICGKYYPYHLTLDYFIKSIREAFDRYGERAKLAEQNEGIDWKAISHAVRAIRQAIELAKIGLIVFPLKESVREELINLKLGNLSWEEASKKIEEGIQIVDKLESYWTGKFNSKLAERFIWDLYGL